MIKIELIMTREQRRQVDFPLVGVPLDVNNLVLIHSQRADTVRFLFVKVDGNISGSW